MVSCIQMYHSERKRIEKKKHKNKLAVVRCAENSKLTITPNQSIDLKGYIDNEIKYQLTCAIIQESRDLSLPTYIHITPTVTY